MHIEDSSGNFIMHFANEIVAERRKEKTLLRRSRLAIVSFLMFLIILSLLLGWLLTTVALADTGQLAFDKELVSWTVGSEPADKKFNLKVNITDVTNLKGMVFSVQWDPTYLNVPSYTMGDFMPTGMPEATGWMITWDKPNGKMEEAANSFMAGYGPKTVAKPSWGWVMTLTFQYVGSTPAPGSPVDTEISIVKNPGVFMDTKWKDQANVWYDFDKLSDPYVHKCHFHYEAEVVPAAIHLESKEDTGVSTNLGTITFDGVSYSLPNDVSKVAGTYQAQYFAGAGYVFGHWETTGMISVPDANANPATVTVSGDGTLKAVYTKVIVTYTVHLESKEDTGVSTNLGTITFDGVSYSLPSDVSKEAGSYEAQYFAEADYVFDHWETAGLVSVLDVNVNPVTVTVSGNGTLKGVYREVTAPLGHHTVHLSEDYVPMIIPFNGKNLTVAPVITCTILENYVFNPFYHPCKLAHTTLTDNDWSDGDANYTYAFEDWTDYDWNDIVVGLYAVTNDMIRVDVLLADREAVWKNPFSVIIVPMGMDVWVHWNSTDYPEEHIFRVNSSETVDIELLAESNPGDTAFLTITPIIPPTYTLTITSTPGGTTDPVPGSYSYDEGTVVSVTAIPNSGYNFGHWELDGNNVGSANPIDVTMNANHTLHAVFTQITYTLTITTTTGGTTDPSPGDHVYPSGTNVPVTAIPQAGYQFDHWELDDVNKGSVNPISVIMDKDHTLCAVFKVVPPPVGGHSVPIDKPHSVVPKIDLTTVIGLAFVLLATVAATVILIRRQKRH